MSGSDLASVSKATDTINRDSSLSHDRCVPSIVNPVFDTRNDFDSRQLTHARGSPIPLSVTVISSDGQALDLLSSPASMRAYLVRSRAVGSNAAFTGARARSDQVFQERVGTAYFWTPDASSTTDSDSRTVRGELLVRPDSKPSFVCPGFSLGVRLSVSPPKLARVSQGA